MSLDKLNVNIQNQTNETWALIPGQDNSQGEAPQSIAPGDAPPFSFHSNFSDIDGGTAYQIDSTHSVSFTWYVPTVGSNSYSATVSPDDGTYSAGYEGGSGYHATIAYTVSGGN